MLIDYILILLIVYIIFNIIAIIGFFVMTTKWFNRMYDEIMNNNK